jgi:hypothetical protein
LDYLPGLNPEIQGVPAWALWFSIIAAHSDLVVFVKEFEDDFRWAQKLEIAMTPDRVRKKVVSIPHDELRWAKKTEYPEGVPTICIGEHGIMSEDEWLRMEAGHAMPFIENYVKSGVPKDRLIVLDESGGVSHYPLDYLVYDRSSS